MSSTTYTSVAGAAGSAMPTVGTPPSGVSARQLADLVECPICFRRLDALADPRALPCLHTFCRKCLTEYHRELPTRGRRRGLLTAPLPTVIPCPCCRREARLPATGVSGLPRNFLTCRISDVLSDVTNVSNRRSSGATTRGGKELKTVKRPQPTAPPMPVAAGEELKTRTNLQPSAPALADITPTSGKTTTLSRSSSTRSQTTSPASTTGSTTIPTVPMRRRKTDTDSTARSHTLPRPSSDPILVPARPAAPAPEVTPRSSWRFGDDDDADDCGYGFRSLGRNKNRNSGRGGRPGFLLTMMGNFLSATR